jgi:hypothetical protein
MDFLEGEAFCCHRQAVVHAVHVAAVARNGKVPGGRDYCSRETVLEDFRRGTHLVVVGGVYDHLQMVSAFFVRL